MRALYGLAFVALLVGAAVVFAAMLHPGGVGGLVEDITGAPDRPPRASGTPKPDNPGADRPKNAVEELTQADGAYDRGDFSLAITYYTVAGHLAADVDERERADFGYNRALLAEALSMDPPPVSVSRDEALRVLEERLAVAESRPSEQAWLDALRYAAGAGINEKIPYTVERALEAAVAGGAVERRVLASLDTGRRNLSRVRRALRARGLGTTMPTDSTGSKTGGFEVPDSGPGDNPFDDDDTASGIGGVSRGGTSKRGDIRVPFGVFTKSTRERLKHAVVLEERGEEEYLLTAPDKTDRNEHRKEAMKFLCEARDIYNDAKEEDPKADALDQRLRRVTKLIAMLRKDTF